MASAVKKIEISQVAPPKDSIAETTIFLTLFDVLCVGLPPVKQIFYFKFSYSKTNILTTILPNLRRSLSLALQHFYPFAGTLTLSPQTGEHQIRYVPDDSVRLTVAESDTDFGELVADHPKDKAQFQPLLPELPESDLISVQLTVFPNSGISIGLSINHIVADGLGCTHFIKHWASISRLGHYSSSISPLPLHDRTLIPDPSGLKRMFLGQSFYQPKSSTSAVGCTRDDKVLATFVLSQAQIEGLRTRVHAEGHCSSFVLMCAYVWVCLTKAEGNDTGDKNVHFMVYVDCRTRMDPPIPVEYFGNCIGSFIASTKGSDLAKGDDEGFSIACERIRREIQRSNEGPLKGADSWIPMILSIHAAGEPLLAAVASPRFKVYDTDFGFGRPVKVELPSIAEASDMSLAESRLGLGVDMSLAESRVGLGVEIGLALDNCEMKRFTSLYEQGLKDLE